MLRIFQEESGLKICKNKNARAMRAFLFGMGLTASLKFPKATSGISS